MAKESRELYITDDALLNAILAKISNRLDVIEGLRPDLDSGVYLLEDGKVISTDPEDVFWKWDGSDDQITNEATARASLGLGTISTQDADDIDVTGGEVQDVLIQITDHNGTIIHAFSSNLIGQFCEWFKFD